MAAAPRRRRGTHARPCREPPRRKLGTTGVPTVRSSRRRDHSGCIGCSNSTWCAPFPRCRLAGRHRHLSNLGAGCPDYLLGLLLQFRRQLIQRAKLHTERLAMMHAGRVFARRHAISTQVAQIGGYGNLIPVETVAALAGIVLLPGPIVQDANTPLPNREAVLFLARYHACLLYTSWPPSPDTWYANPATR